MAQLTSELPKGAAARMASGRRLCKTISSISSNLSSQQCHISKLPATAGLELLEFLLRAATGDILACPGTFDRVEPVWLISGSLIIRLEFERVDLVHPMPRQVRRSSGAYV